MKRKPVWPQNVMQSHGPLLNADNRKISRNVKVHSKEEDRRDEKYWID